MALQHAFKPYTLLAKVGASRTLVSGPEQWGRVNFFLNKFRKLGFIDYNGRRTYAG